MRSYIVNRPDPHAMKRILSTHLSDAVGTIIRLAWYEGLLRDEIVSLTWDNVSFLNGQIELADRTVPLLNGMERFLADLSEQQSETSDRVLLSDRYRKPITPQHVSRLIREALDAEGQKEVRLIDLRHDFVIRQLEKNHWQYTSRITGLTATSLQLHFADYLPKKQLSTRVQNKKHTQIDEFRLWKLLQQEETSAVGLTLRLTWQAGLYLNEISGLTWGQVDWNGRRLVLKDGRIIRLRQDLFHLLETLKQENAPNAPVVFSPRAHKPIPQARLSKLTRAALVNAGLDNITMRDLRMDYELRLGGEELILNYVRKNHRISRNETAEILQVSEKTAYHRLKRLVQYGKLVQVGTKYYLPDTVVPPEQQREAVMAYLRKEQIAYRNDITNLLHTEPSQVSLLLKHMVIDGEIVCDKQRYSMKDA